MKSQARTLNRANLRDASPKRKTANLRRQLRAILKRHDVAHAALFGSFARGQEPRDSDLDILIKFRGQKSLLDLVGLKLELEEKTQRKVDVVAERALHPAIRERVLSEQVAIL